jgi:hypothetical protein
MISFAPHPIIDLDIDLRSSYLSKIPPFGWTYSKMSVLTMGLRPHLTLVSGASGGIGKATCRSLASMGCTIAVHYHSSTEAANALVEELRGMGVKAEAFKADLTNYEKVRFNYLSPLQPSHTILSRSGFVSHGSKTKSRPRSAYSAQP